MTETLDYFKGIVSDPYTYLAKWKAETDKPIIGCFPMYVPEEIVHAGGMLPVTVMDSNEAISQADRYMMTCTCHVVRSTLDLALQGKMDFIDGLIFPDICEPIQVLTDVWRLTHPAPFHYNFIVPLNMITPASNAYLIGQFEALRDALSKFSGKEISDEAIKRSIAVYNENRRLLSRLYDIRRAAPESISASDMIAVVAASMLMPKEDHTRYLGKLLEELAGAMPDSNGRVRLVISGALCDRPEPDILKIFEDVDAVVVDDDLHSGSRYFATLVDETLPPLEALARRYMNDVPCPTKHNFSNDWGAYLIRMVKESHADAVVMLMAKYCEPYAHDYPDLKRKLDEAGIPHLAIETDHGPAPVGQIRTRLQALIELVGK